MNAFPSRKVIIKKQRCDAKQRTKDYYKNDTEKLRDTVRDKYTNLSEEEENMKREYGRNGYHNMSEEKKQKFKKYKKKKKKKKLSCG